MARLAITATIVATVGAAVVAFGPTEWSGTFACVGSPPSNQTNGVWHWAAAAPSMNIYVADGGKSDDGRFAFAWVNRRYFSNVAGIDKSVIEPMQFDCHHRMSRRSTASEFRAIGEQQRARTSDALSGWKISPSGTTDERILLVACEHTDARLASMTAERN